jgi:hypothetical protein
MKVGKKLAAGIETGQETAASAKETVGMSFLRLPWSSLVLCHSSLMFFHHRIRMLLTNSPEHPIRRRSQGEGRGS